MENIAQSQNITGEEKTTGKNFSLTKLLAVLMFLIVLGVLGFIFKDKIINLLSLKGNEKEKNSRGVELPQKSVFENFVNGTEDNSDKYLAEKYKLNDLQSGQTQYFKGVSDSKIITELGSYELDRDFIIICNKDKILFEGEMVDASSVKVSYSSMSEKKLADLIRSYKVLSFEDNVSFLENYPQNDPLILGFTKSNQDNLQVNIVNIFVSDPESCYK